MSQQKFNSLLESLALNYSTRNLTVYQQDCIGWEKKENPMLGKNIG